MQRTLEPLDEAAARLIARLAPLATERVPLEEARGRILISEVRADRPSPPVDVSAMDGYAVRLQDVSAIESGGLLVQGEAFIGTEIRELPPATAMRIFTGSPVPAGADAVIKREDLTESPDRISSGPTALSVKDGMNIRRAGENAQAGDLVVPSGVLITSPVIAALASFGISSPEVHKRVRVAIVVTGNEVAPAGESPTSTGLRDSNGPMLVAVLEQIPWIDVVRTDRVQDDPDEMRSVIGLALEGADCVITTGGVSMGDHDHVPEIAESLGGEAVFHRLKIKPGKPVFGAVYGSGKAFIGLPGNPVSSLVTARMIALPALATLAGAPIEAVAADAHCQIDNNDTRPIDLERFLLINRSGANHVRLITGRGSGDIAALAASEGVVRIPPGDSGDGPYDCYFWSLS